MTNESIGIDKIASELRESAGIIRNLIQGKDAPQLAEFVDAVEKCARDFTLTSVVYCKDLL